MSLNLFERLVTHGSLTIISADGQTHQFGAGPPAATMRLHRSDTLTKILRNPQLNLGETYMAGEWDVPVGTLHDLLTVLRTNLEAQVGRPGLARYFAALLQPWNHVAASYRNVRHHYDLDESLFRAFLDRNMHYSSAYFCEPGMSLEAAQQAKCDHIARKLCLRPGLRILDIGSGWGSLAMELAEKYDVEVTGLTLSAEQIRVARDEAARRSLTGSVRFELEDYRQHDDRYDRIVSVGMFEHVGRRHYPTYFDKVSSMLTDDGIALLHTIGVSGPPTPVNPWIKRHIFPGGHIPAQSEVAPFVERAGLITADLEVLRGHYALTLKEWNRRFQTHRQRFVTSKGEAFCRMWEFYLVACQTAFEISDLVVHHWQLARSNLSVPVTRDYLYVGNRFAGSGQESPGRRMRTATDQQEAHG